MKVEQEYTMTSPAEQFNTVLETRLPEIIGGEATNTSTIHLYRTGNFWVAFEKSAYLLTQSAIAYDTSAMQLPSHPTPIVMAYTDDITITILLQKHTLLKSDNNYTAIATSPISAELYKEWHTEEIELFEYI